MKLEHKSFATASVEAPDDAPGQVSAVVAVFNNVDHGKDRIRPGFFAKSLERKLPKGVWGHDWASPIAKTLEARELMPGDPLLPDQIKHLGGLYIRGQFNLDTQRGREAYSDVKFGIIDEFSIGYRTTRAETDKKSGVRDLIEGEVHEWSPVLVGMNDQTRLLSVKGRRNDESSPGVVPANQRATIAGAKFLGFGPESRPEFGEHSRDVVSAIGEFLSRAESRTRARTKAGRELSESNRTEIESACQALETGVGRLRAILDRTQPAAKSDATPPPGPEATPPAQADIQAKAASVDPDVVRACFTRLMDTSRLVLMGEVAGDGI